MFVVKIEIEEQCCGLDFGFTIARKQTDTTQVSLAQANIKLASNKEFEDGIFFFFSLIFKFPIGMYSQASVLAFTQWRTHITLHFKYFTGMNLSDS